MYDFIIEDDGLTGKIIFSGSLTIENAIYIKECLLNSIEKVKELLIDHQDATKYDVTYLQMLTALHNSAGIMGKNVTLNYSKSFDAFVKDAGLENYKFLISDEDISWRLKK